MPLHFMAVGLVEYCEEIQTLIKWNLYSIQIRCKET